MVAAEKAPYLAGTRTTRDYGEPVAHSPADRHLSPWCLVIGLGTSLDDAKRSIQGDCTTGLIFLVEEANDVGYTTRTVGAFIFTEVDTRGELRLALHDANIRGSDNSSGQPVGTSEGQGTVNPLPPDESNLVQ